jgi:hypothetical protein
MLKGVKIVVPEDVEKGISVGVFGCENGIKIPIKKLKTIYKPRLI